MYYTVLYTVHFAKKMWKYSELIFKNAWRNKNFIIVSKIHKKLIPVRYRNWNYVINLKNRRIKVPAG